MSPTFGHLANTLAAYPTICCPAHSTPALPSPAACFALQPAGSRGTRHGRDGAQVHTGGLGVFKLGVFKPPKEVLANRQTASMPAFYLLHGHLCIGAACLGRVEKACSLVPLPHMLAWRDGLAKLQLAPWLYCPFFPPAKRRQLTGPTCAGQRD